MSFFNFGPQMGQQQPTGQMQPTMMQGQQFQPMHGMQMGQQMQQPQMHPWGPMQGGQMGQGHQFGNGAWGGQGGGLMSFFRHGGGQGFGMGGQG